MKKKLRASWEPVTSNEDLLFNSIFSQRGRAKFQKKRMGGYDRKTNNSTPMDLNYEIFKNISNCQIIAIYDIYCATVNHQLEAEVGRRIASPETRLKQKDRKKRKKR